VTAGVEGCRAGHDDEEGDHVRDDAAEDDVPARVAVVLEGHALLHDRRLQVELHPGRDRGAHEPDDHVEAGGVQVRRGLEGVEERLLPVGVGQEARERIGDVEDAGDEEHPLDHPVGAAQDEPPDEDRPEGDGDVAVHAEDRHARGEPGELGDRVAEVGDEKERHQDEGDAEAVLLTDEVGEALARDHPHAGDHLLDDDEGHRDRDERPQERVAEARAGDGVRVDPAGVVVDVGGDDPGAEDAQEDEEVAPESAGGAAAGHALVPLSPGSRA
jgi:hypothetical protein